MLKSILYRPLLFTGLGMVLLLLLSLALLTGKTWSSIERLRPLRTHTVELARLQQIQAVQLRMLEALESGDPIAAPEQEAVRREIVGVIALGSYLAPETPGKLQSAFDALRTADRAPRSALVESLGWIREAIDAEFDAHDTLLTEIQRNYGWELGISLGLVGAVPLVGALVAIRLHWRVWLPLQSLG